MAAMLGTDEAVRAQAAGLRALGLSEDEALLVAERRALRQRAAQWDAAEAFVVLALAVAAAVAIKVPELFGLRFGAHGTFYPLNLGFFAFTPPLVYLAWKRGLGSRATLALGVSFGVAAVVANAYPFVPRAHTMVLAALHMPAVLWLVLGIAHAGNRWTSVEGRMGFVRFSGEAFIHYVLMALGGGVLMLLTMALFNAIGIDAEPLVEWVGPSAAMGAVVVAAWLVDARQGVIGNIAPVLARIFTPLFAVALVGFLAAMAWTGGAIDRNALIAFDVLLALVLGLLLYSISARDRAAPAGPFDALLVALVVGALVADAFALAAMATRVSELGATPNRVAALGFNVVLLVNLAGSAVLHVRFLRGGVPFERLEKWQTDYLPVYAAWAAIVVVLLPPWFRYA